MHQHTRCLLAGVMVSFALFAPPAVADPEWIECTIDEVSVLGSHLEVSCSAVYVATTPPSLQERHVASRELQERERTSEETQGRAPRSTAPPTRTPHVSEQQRGTTRRSLPETRQPTARPQVTVSSPIPLPPGKSAIRVYAVAHSSPASQAILQLLIAAQQPGFTLQIKTDYGDISGVPFGCPERDCRRIQEVRIFHGVP